MTAETFGRFGGSGLIWAARIGLIYCAGAALWRVALYVFSEFGGVPLELPEASLTFMPIPDFIFTLVFLFVAAVIGRPLTAWILETGIIAGGLHAACLISYLVIFYGWTKGEALGFDRLSTYLHVVLPVLICMAVALRLAWIAWQAWRTRRVLSAGAAG